MEPPSGLVEGRSGANAWDPTLPNQNQGSGSGSGSGSGTMINDASATWLSAPTRSTQDGSVGNYNTKLSLHAPGRYALGIFIDGQLVGNPFIVQVLPAPPVAAASELLLPLSALSLNPFNDTALYPSLRATWASAAAVFAGDTLADDNDASISNARGNAAWGNAMARAVSLLERELGTIGIPASSAAVPSIFSNAMRDTFNVLLAAIDDPLAITATRIDDDGLLVGAPPLTESLSTVTTTGGRHAIVPRYISAHVASILVGKREPILIVPLKSIDLILRVSVRAIQMAAPAGLTNMRASWLRDPPDALLAPRPPIGVRLRDATARAPLTSHDAFRNQVYLSLRRADGASNISRSSLISLNSESTAASSLSLMGALPSAHINWLPLGAALSFVNNKSLLNTLAINGSSGGGIPSVILEAAKVAQTQAAGAHWLDALLLLPGTSSGTPDGGGINGRAGHGLSMRSWADENSAAAAAWAGIGGVNVKDARGSPPSLFPSRPIRGSEVDQIETGPYGCDGVRVGSDSPCMSTIGGPLNVTHSLWKGAKTGSRVIEWLGALAPLASLTYSGGAVTLYVVCSDECDLEIEGVLVASVKREHHRRGGAAVNGGGGGTLLTGVDAKKVITAAAISGNVTNDDGVVATIPLIAREGQPLSLRLIIWRGGGKEVVVGDDDEEDGYVSLLWSTARTAQDTDGIRFDTITPPHVIPTENLYWGAEHLPGSPMPVLISMTTTK